VKINKVLHFHICEMLIQGSDCAFVHLTDDYLLISRIRVIVIFEKHHPCLSGVNFTRLASSS
jgi:hypothetical protein